MDYWWTFGGLLADFWWTVVVMDSAVFVVVVMLHQVVERRFCEREATLTDTSRLEAGLKVLQVTMIVARLVMFLHEVFRDPP